MVIECVKPFGIRVPGDQQIIPDDAQFDHYYFREVPDSTDNDNPPTPTPPVNPEIEVTVDVELIPDGTPNVEVITSTEPEKD